MKHSKKSHLENFFVSICFCLPQFTVARLKFFSYLHLLVSDYFNTRFFVSPDIDQTNRRQFLFHVLFLRRSWISSKKAPFEEGRKKFSKMKNFQAFIIRENKKLPLSLNQKLLSIVSSNSINHWVLIVTNNNFINKLYFFVSCIEDFILSLNFNIFCT